MRSALFCDVTQHVVVIGYRRFRTPTCPIFKDKKSFLTPSWILEP